MSKALTDAAASWFGMNPDQLAQANMTVGSSGRLRFTFTVEATDEDYLGICDRMVAMREPEPHGSADGQEDQPAFVPIPTINEVMRRPLDYIDRPECVELLRRAMAMSKQVRQEVCEAREKQIGMPVFFNESAPENRIQAKMQEAQEEKFEHIWLARAHVSDQQRAKALAHRGAYYAIRMEDLTEIQRASLPKVESYEFQQQQPRDTGPTHSNTDHLKGHP